MILKNGVLGKVIQSAGDLTACGWKDLTVVKTKITENLSKTDAQVFQRDRFKYIQNFATKFKDTVIPEYWEKWATGKTTYFNAFNSYNIMKQPEAEEPVVPFVADPEALRFTRGNLEPLASIAPVAYDSGYPLIEVTWSKAVSGNGLVTDKVIIVVYVKDKDMIYISSSATRDDESVIVTIPSGLSAAANNIMLSVSTARGLGKESIASEGVILFATAA